jgi:folate-dependent phosphoribosylglycinamide formyltransferase PurN
MLTARPLRIAVLCSGRAPGFEQLLASPSRGNLFEIACVVTSEESLPVQFATLDGIPVHMRPLRAFHRACGASLADRDVRRQFDGLTVELLRQYEVDVVVLLGYLYIVTDTLLRAFGGRVVNVHDSDLALRNADGAPRYAGLRSTLDAIRAGERETRSTIHFVTDQLDAGPVLLRSEPYPVPQFVASANAAGAIDIVKAYAYAQREWTMRNSCGELVVDALEHIGAGFGPADVASWEDDEAFLIDTFARQRMGDPFEQAAELAFAEAG